MSAEQVDCAPMTGVITITWLNVVTIRRIEDPWATVVSVTSMKLQFNYEALESSFTCSRNKVSTLKTYDI